MKFKLGLVMRFLFTFAPAFLLSLSLSISNIALAEGGCQQLMSGFITPGARAGLERITAEMASQGVSAQTLKQMDHLKAVSFEPNIVMAAMEFGNLKLAEQVIKLSIGGEAVVVNDFMKLLPEYMKTKIGGGKLSLVIPAFGGLDLSSGRVIKSFDLSMGEHAEGVELVEYTIKLKNKDGSESEAQVIFVKNHAFERYHHSKIYEADPSHPPLPGADGTPTNFYNQAYSLGVFNKAIKAAFELKEGNVYIPHDYHTVLASKYIESDPSILTIIHNGGYQGDLWAHGYHGRGGERDYSQNYPFGVPTGDARGMDKIRDILDFSFDDYLKFTEHDGSFNMLKLIQTYVEPRNGINKTVSEGYQEELALSRDDIFAKIQQQKNSGAHNADEVYIFNNNVDLGPVRGTDNGLDIENHAAHNPLLAAKDEIKDPFVAYRIQELAKTDAHKARELEELFLHGLKYGDDLQSVAGRQALKESKAKLKEALQYTMGLEVNPDKPVFTVISRIVDQKNLTPFVENVRRIVEGGGQVVIGGPIGDEAGARSIARLKEIMDELPHELRSQVALISGDVFAEDGSQLIKDGRVMNELKVMMMGGGDFFFITSKFEPCGLTDIEAAWMGSMIIGRKTGGLGKITSGFYYDWWDSSDYAGEIEEAWKVAARAINLYQHDKADFMNRVVAGMEQDFNWNDKFDRLFAEIKFTAIKKIMNSLSSDVEAGRIGRDVAIERLAEILGLLDQPTRNEIRDISLLRAKYFAVKSQSLPWLEASMLRNFE